MNQPISRKQIERGNINDMIFKYNLRNYYNSIKIKTIAVTFGPLKSQLFFDSQSVSQYRTVLTTAVEIGFF